MARARHRLTALRQAVVNTVEIKKPGNEFTVVANMDHDTYTYHVGGLDVGGGRDYNVNLGGATGHTGSSSDSFLMAQGIQKTGTGPSGLSWTPPYEREHLVIGAWLPDDFVTKDTANTPRWRYEFNSRNYSSTNTSGQTYDGSLGGRANRAYLLIDLNLDENSYENGEVKVANGDTIVSAQLCFNLSAILFHDNRNFLDTRFPNLSGVYNVDPTRIISGASFDTGGTYCAYKVVRGFTTGDDLGNINWLGWSGDKDTSDAESDYWIKAGGSEYSAVGNTGDISDLGVSSCYTFLDGDWYDTIPRGLPPETNDFGAIFGGRPTQINREDTDVENPDIGEDDSDVEQPGDEGNPPEVEDLTQICFDVTHIVQDAVDNESNIVRIAIYREDDGGASAVPAALTSTTFNDSTYDPPTGSGSTASLLTVYDQSQDDTSTPSDNSRALFHENFRHAIRVHSANSPKQNLRPKLTYTFIDNT